MAPFDPLTSWIVALLANAFAASGQSGNNVALTQSYSEKIKKSNDRLNAEIRRRLTQESYLPESELSSIKALMESYKKRYEYNFGAVELELDVQELMIKLYKECIAERQKTLKEYEDSYKTQKENRVAYSKLAGIVKLINNEKNAINSYQLALTTVEAQRNIKKQEIAQKQKTEKENEDNEKVYLFGLLLIVFVILLIIVF